MAATSSPSPMSMDPADCYVAGNLGQRPSQDKRIVVANGVMIVELQKLCQKAVFLCAMGNVMIHRPEEVAYALHRQLCIPYWNISISAHKPESFLVCFDYLDQRDAAVLAASVQIWRRRLPHPEVSTRGLNQADQLVLPPEDLH
jgi:hypothetical protein